MFDSGKQELQLERVYSETITSEFTVGSLDNFTVPTVLYCIIFGHLGSWA